MKVVFVHPHGLGQFVHLAGRLANDGWDVTLLCQGAHAAARGVRVLNHGPAARSDLVAPSPCHLAAVDYHVRMGSRIADLLARLRLREGVPDIVVGHIGWGGLLFVKDVLPDIPVLAYCEFFHLAQGADVGFDPSDEVTLHDRKRLRARNFAQLATLHASDAAFSPTAWQRSLYPASVRDRLAVCHDGIDVSACRPNPSARFVLPDGRALAAGDPVVTFVARSLEPYRGFPQFLRAARKVLQKRPDAVIVVVGNDDVSYGKAPVDGGNWRELLLAETGLEPDRIQFVGILPYSNLVKLFQVSAAHVYLTYPFVLSWSMLEAMACQTLVVGSSTPPVVEFIENERNGLTVSFFDPDEIASAVLAALERPATFAQMRARARQTIIDRVALSKCVQRQVRAIDRLVSRASAVLSG